jgi:uncharacterized membrane protein required for colicin V production
LFIDLAIGLALLVALIVGYQRGVIQPLLVEIFFLAAILVIIRDRQAYSAAMGHFLHANPILDVFLALIIAVVAGYIGGVAGAAIRRMPVIRGVDGFLGIFVHLAVATIVIYLLLSALVQLDKAFNPTIRTATMTAAQVNQLASSLLSNPLTASIVDTHDLDKLHKEAATPSGARLADVPQLNQLDTFFLDFVQPQLHSSRAAPVILGIGSRIPLIGHTGPGDLKALEAQATPSPSPSAKATPKVTPSPSKKP